MQLPRLTLLDSRDGEQRNRKLVLLGGFEREKEEKSFARTHIERREKERWKKTRSRTRVPRVPMVLRPTFESTPPFTIRPNYPSGNPFHPSFTFSRCFTTANYTYLRPQAVSPAETGFLWILYCFDYTTGGTKGPGADVFLRPLPISLCPLSPARLIDPRYDGADVASFRSNSGIDISQEFPIAFSTMKLYVFWNSFSRSSNTPLPFLRLIKSFLSKEKMLLSLNSYIE